MKKIATVVKTGYYASKAPSTPSYTYKGVTYNSEKDVKAAISGVITPQVVQQIDTARTNYNQTGGGTAPTVKTTVLGNTSSLPQSSFNNVTPSALDIQNQSTADDILAQYYATAQNYEIRQKLAQQEQYNQSVVKAFEGVYDTMGKVNTLNAAASADVDTSASGGFWDTVGRAFQGGFNEVEKGLGIGSASTGGISLTTLGLIALGVYFIKK